MPHDVTNTNNNQPCEAEPASDNPLQNASLNRRGFIGASLTVSAGSLAALSLPGASVGIEAASGPSTLPGAWEQIKASGAALKGLLGKVEQVSALRDQKVKHQTISEIVKEMHLHARSGRAAQDELLKELAAESGEKLTPIRTMFDKPVQQANGTLAKLNGHARGNTRAREDLDKQLSELEKREKQKLAEKKALKLELQTVFASNSLRVREQSLGTTERFVVTVVNHSKESETETHINRKALLQNVHWQINSCLGFSLAASDPARERWIIRNPRGVFREVLLETAAGR